MLTPLDIQKKEFGRAFRGYSVGEVDSFLDRINQDYESLYKENQDLKERLSEADRNMARYREIEEVLKNTMVMAQKNAEDLKQNAEKEARLLLEQVRLQAERLKQEAEANAAEMVSEAGKRAGSLIAEAEEKLKVMFEEYRQLEKQARIFRARFRSLLEAELKLLDGEEEGVADNSDSGEEELTASA
ncbi:MAG: DivIVA domain-containing protein [Firmicutes bacterium]|nr:DivIVA domain-containing protein [Bacillota bacterium]